MKKNIFMIISLISLTGYGQTYFPLPDSNAVWNIYQGVDCQQSPAKFYDGTYSIVMKGDTVLNGRTYKQLWVPYFILGYDFFCNPNPSAIRNSYKGGIRQDKAGKKVYFFKSDALDEQLLYDFTLDVGDTLKTYITRPHYNVVKKIDSVMVDGAYHKRWKIGTGEDPGESYGYYMIEGVGSDGVIEPMYEITSTVFNTRCLKVGNKSIYPENASCETVTGIGMNLPAVNKVTIFPNPSNGVFTIESKENITSVRITDLLGKIVFQQILNNQSGYKINSLQKGTYILTIFDNNNQQTNQKIIVCD